MVELWHHSILALEGSWVPQAAINNATTITIEVTVAPISTLRLLANFRPNVSKNSFFFYRFPQKQLLLIVAG